MISVSICDDNKTFLEKLRGEVIRTMTKYKMSHTVQCFSTGKEFLEHHLSAPFDGK